MNLRESEVKPCEPWDFVAASLQGVWVLSRCLPCPIPDSDSDGLTHSSLGESYAGRFTLDVNGFKKPTFHWASRCRNNGCLESIWKYAVRIIPTSHFLAFFGGDYVCGVCDPQFLVANVASVANPQERWSTFSPTFDDAVCVILILLIELPFRPIAKKSHVLNST